MPSRCLEAYIWLPDRFGAQLNFDGLDEKIDCDTLRGGTSRTFGAAVTVSRCHGVTVSRCHGVTGAVANADYFVDGIQVKGKFRTNLLKDPERVTISPLSDSRGAA